LTQIKLLKISIIDIRYNTDLAHLLYENLIVKQILKLPLWFIGVFSTAKSFNGNPIIGSKLANQLGLHVFRLLLSHSIMKVRIIIMGFFVNEDDRLSYQKNGFIVKKEFLSTQMLEEIKREIKNFEGETRQSKQGDSLVYRAVLEPDIVEKMPAMKSFFELPEFRHLCNYTGGHIRPPLLYIEKINSHAVKIEINDPQKTLHSDTFHPNMKFWFFLHDVKEKDGPFKYIKGSHKLTWKRLKWEYKRSITVKNNSDEMTLDGSFRFDDDAIKYLGLDNPIHFTVPSNTLLFANTFGIHCRGEAIKGATRE